MASSNDPEKDSEAETRRNSIEATASSSDLEKGEVPPKEDDDCPNGYPDTDHEEVEEMDQGHIVDLELQRVSASVSFRNPVADFSRPRRLSEQDADPKTTTSIEQSPEPATKAGFPE